MRLSAADTGSVVARLRAAGCVFAEDEAALLIGDAATVDALEEGVSRRVAGDPLEYILGWALFAGRRYSVAPGVFVPRPRTEFLVGHAVALTKPRAIVLDLCCGTGALGGAVLAAVPSVELYASDIDSRSARQNLGSDRVYEGDLYEPLPRAIMGRVDILLANTPYVPTGQIDLLPREARLFEARETLDGGKDGLDLQRRVAAEAPQWLAEGGHLFVESSEAQAEASVRIIEASGLTAWIVSDDELDATVVIGRNG